MALCCKPAFLLISPPAACGVNGYVRNKNLTSTHEAGVRSFQNKEGPLQSGIAQHGERLRSISHQWKPIRAFRACKRVWAVMLIRLSSTTCAEGTLPKHPPFIRIDTIVWISQSVHIEVICCGDIRRQVHFTFVRYDVCATSYFVKRHELKGTASEEWNRQFRMHPLTCGVACRSEKRQAGSRSVSEINYPPRSISDFTKNTWK